MDGYGYDVITVIIIVMFLLARLLWGAVTRETERTESPSETYDEEDEQRTPRTYQPAPSRTKPLILALRDHDWEKRSAAAIALGTLGDRNAIEPLVKTLLYDGNEVVRENAALSLGKIDGGSAPDPLIKVVNNYLMGTEKATGPVVASATSLGEIGNPKALQCLTQLGASLRRVGLNRESKAVSEAINKIKSAAKLAGKKCAVCNLPFRRGESLVRCPSCRNIAHRTHMLEWLHVKDSCPVCQQHLSETDLEEVQNNYVSGKSRSPS